MPLFLLERRRGRRYVVPATGILILLLLVYLFVFSGDSSISAAPSPAPPPPLRRRVVDLSQVFSAAGSTPWKPRAPGDPGWDIFVPCAPATCVRHARDTPRSLWRELATFRFRIVYVVSGDPEDVFVPPGVSRSSFVVLSTRTGAEEYPPTNKEMGLLRYFASHAARASSLLIHADHDVVFVPERVAGLLRGLDANRNDLYVGRPTSSCECANLPSSASCTYDTAIHACSGFFYVTNRATLSRLSSESFRPALNGSRECRSSDLSLGFLMNQELGLTCEALRDPRVRASSYPGLTYPLTRDGRRPAERLPLCQQRGSPGGVHVARTVTVPWFLDAHHRRDCAVLHPAKLSSDVQYVWNVLGQGGDDAAGIDVVSQTAASRECVLAVFLPVRPIHFDRRQHIRVTWGKNARALGVRVRFVLGEPEPEHDLRLLRAALEFENATHGDLVHSAHVEGYYDLAWKTLESLEDFARVGDCDYFAKVDPDTYFRPYHALKMLELLEVREADADAEFYVGHVWDAKGSGYAPNVVHDASNAWFLGYDGDYYPPYASGYAYVMSARLAYRVLPCLRERVRTGAEDVQTGLCVHRVKSSEHTRIVHAPEMAYDADCDEATVADNAVAAPAPYNVHQRHEAHIRDDFCALGRRAFRASGRAYEINVDMFDASVASPRAKDAYVGLVVPPWDILDAQHAPELFEFGAVPKSRRRAFGSKAAAFRCVSCLENWYLVIRGGVEHAVVVGARDASEFGVRRALDRRIDLGVVGTLLCSSSERVAAFSARLKTLGDARVVIATVGSCSARDLRRDVVAASGIAESDVVVMSVENVARAHPALLAAAREDAVLIVGSDLQIESWDRAFLDRMDAFVRPRTRMCIEEGGTGNVTSVYAIAGADALAASGEVGFEGGVKAFLGRVVRKVHVVRLRAV